MNDRNMPAYPCPESSQCQFGDPTVYTGMTLRDYFAAQVIAQQLRYCETNESAARQAYKIADAMMEWRK